VPFQWEVAKYISRKSFYAFNDHLFPFDFLFFYSRLYSHPGNPDEENDSGRRKRWRLATAPIRKGEKITRHNPWLYLTVLP
jgi:hypothetical protein